MTPGRARWLWLAGPILFLLVLYWDGLHAWFIADDFAWLGLIRQVHSFRQLISVLFEPAAQGTIRPWSERGFFLLFENIFGMDPLPFRIMVFITVAADLWLLGWITRRITHSRLAALVAQICWTANAALATVMSWTAAYNEALCPLFLLTALALFCRFVETGARRFWWWQVVVFSLGFGALELNVVYPAIAAGFVFFVAPAEKRRGLLVSLIPLAGISVAYFLLHRALAPLPTAGAYAIHLDARVFSTLAGYLKWSLLPMSWRGFGHSVRTGRLLFALEALGLLAFFIAEIRRRRPTILFFVVWFLATLAPMLILPDHRDDYYLTIPLMGLAMLAGFAVTRGSRDLGRRRVVALIPILAYLTAEIPVAHSATHWWLLKTVPVKAIVLGAQAARQAHPGKTLLLDGVGQQVYEDSLGQGALYPLGIDDVYLAPSPDVKIQGGPGLADPAQTVIEPAVVLHALANDQVVVYSIAGDHLRNVTERYERSAPSRLGDRLLPSRVDVGNPLYSWLIGPEWMRPENGVRWMPGQGSLRLGSPKRAGQKLRIEGYCPEDELRRAPRHLTVSAGGLPAGDVQINDPEATFVRLFDLPEALMRTDSLEVVIRVSPVVRKDGQEFGLLFGNIAIVP
ncbi:MAG: hypothetical protein M3N54_13005 [Acidobacteriota bacterium]|nr:hypothetical protein [Acidobacteriota bacterium]